MEDTEILKLWKSYDQKLEASLLLNTKNAEALMHLEVRSSLASMKPLKYFTLLLGVLWVAAVAFLLLKTWHFANVFFLASMGFQSLLTLIATGIYFYQLVLISRISSDEPVLEAQRRLSRLRSSTLFVARLLFLQLPAWTTFYWNKSMLVNGNIFLYALQVLITLAFIFLAVWLFVNIKYENKDKKWFKLIFRGKEWEPVLKSIELYKEIEAFKK